MNKLVAHLDNQDVAAQYQGRENGRAAFVAVLQWQEKTGRKWLQARRVYVSREAAERDQEWLSRIFGNEVRNFELFTHLIHG